MTDRGVVGGNTNGRCVARKRKERRSKAHVQAKGQDGERGQAGMYVCTTTTTTEIVADRQPGKQGQKGTERKGAMKCLFSRQERRDNQRWLQPTITATNDDKKKKCAGADDDGMITIRNSPQEIYKQPEDYLVEENTMEETSWDRCCAGESTRAEIKERSTVRSIDNYYFPPPQMATKNL